MARLHSETAWAVLRHSKLPVIDETTVNSCGDSYAIFRFRKDARSYADKRPVVKVTIELAPKRRK